MFSANTPFLESSSFEPGNAFFPACQLVGLFATSIVSNWPVQGKLRHAFFGRTWPHGMERRSSRKFWGVRLRAGRPEIIQVGSLSKRYSKVS